MRENIWGTLVNNICVVNHIEIVYILYLYTCYEINSKKGCLRGEVDTEAHILISMGNKKTMLW